MSLIFRDYFILVLLFFCCIEGYSNQQSKLCVDDSVSVSINIPPKSYCSLGIRDVLNQVRFIRFENESEKMQIITKSIFVIDRYPVLEYRVIKFDSATKKRQFFYHDFIIKKEFEKTDTLHFEFKGGDLFSLNNNAVSYDDLYRAYFKSFIAVLERNKVKQYSKQDLDSIYFVYHNNDKYSNDYYMNQLNKLYYIRMIQEIEPSNKLVEEYFMNNCNSEFYYSVVKDIYLKFIKNRNGVLKFKTLNSNFYNKNTLYFISLSMYLFLKDVDNKGKSQFESARKWLRTTELYRHNKDIIEPDIMPLNNDEFKRQISGLFLLNDKFETNTFSVIIKENPSEYYLLDFWATWCKPCLDGIKRIHNMNIPQNVKVINLGTDKLDKKNIWRKKAIETQQKLSYLIDLSDNQNKDFLKYIKLNSIPRYILIDKNLNLIDESFFPPHDPNFLFELKRVKLF